MVSVWQRAAVAGAAVAAIVAAAAARGDDGKKAPDAIVIDAGYHHLGDTEVKDWPEVPAKPEGRRLEVKFKAKANPGAEKTLAIAHRDVAEAWALQLNGTEIALLKREERKAVYHYPVPAGALRDGENTLVVAPYRLKDDISIGDIRLLDATLREVLGLRKVRVRVVDRDGGRPVPARITIANASGERAVDFEPYYAEAALTAVRKGLLYTSAEGEVGLEVPDGDYTLYATRGMEWSLARRPLAVRGAEGEPRETVTLEIGREVDTRGFIAADTHVHTVTFSGHGDASLRERLVTLAGEGVEMAVATDHNHHTDYRPLQKEMGLGRHYTAVVGNEVTTENGHFNAFPLNPKGPVPPHKEKDWPKLVEGMRECGAKVVILNHPRWPKIDTGPFGKFGLDRATGERASGTKFTFDAMELVNSTTLLDDPLYLFRDWFALLRHGERIVAVGTSDSHSVGDAVGQGRTYVRSSTDDPTKIDVDEICRNLRAGDCSVSLGIFADGALAKDGREIALRVAAPSWVRPERAILFVNGEKAAELAVPAPESGKPTDARLAFPVPAAAAAGRGAWAVCVVLGKGLKGPYWPIERDYTLAATNPMRLDGLAPQR